MRIAFASYSNMLITSISLPMEMLSAAENFLLSDNRKGDRLLMDLVGTDSDHYHSRNPLRFTTNQMITSAGQQRSTDSDTTCAPTIYDLVVLPAIWRNPARVVRKNPQLANWLCLQHQHGARLCAVGTGCYFLAETGLLDGQPATTHWYYFKQFQQRYPQVKLQRKRFITKAETIYCAGSVNAVGELMVQIIKECFNQTIAANVERHFFHEIRHAQANDNYLDNDIIHHDEDIMRCQQWLKEHCHQEITLNQVAADFGFSTRSFNRRFKAATDKTPLQYLQELRISLAKDLLKNSNLSVGEIGYQVGYQDAGYVTGIFKRLTTITPQAYRDTVRGKLFRLTDDRY